MSEIFENLGMEAVEAGAVDLLLIRHGHYESRADHPEMEYLDGHENPPLSATGLSQAAALASRLKPIGISAIYTSNLKRTQQTAAPLAEALELSPTALPDLREVFFGEWEGGGFESNLTERAVTFRELLRTGLFGVIPGAEADDAIRARVRSALESIVAEHRGERVAVFTHGGIINAALANAFASPRTILMAIDHTSVTQIVARSAYHMVRRANDVAHLEFKLRTRSNTVL